MRLRRDFVLRIYFVSRLRLVSYCVKNVYFKAIRSTQLAEDLLKDRSLPCPTIRLCFTVDEEIGRGVDKLDLDVLGADVAYTLDGSSTGTLSAETFNAAEALVTVDGVMVHPGYAKGVMVNAVASRRGIGD